MPFATAGEETIGPLAWNFHLIPCSLGTPRAEYKPLCVASTRNSGESATAAIEQPRHTPKTDNLAQHLESCFMNILTTTLREMPTWQLGFGEGQPIGAVVIGPDIF